ncbi:hypothetical protein CC1G_09041 [Coprinopsis cinerea okayama7|uniref:RNase H type-1 domain-containing protein n=1 Tax=Coprinopsis cinerea (strain Okayama-7 / 130 / ATCC MYA-4618 / FGSC 9003) TaxID=240176 RepID=A8N9K6_COPC7|nr:hypothetical protein CC1G_09041 [Coprinopsis cinerea okayama7\|eukprot:XP_001831512.2 hypothetical protein CC1G_09041 [Coprinopsis cinerea okayama7\
MMGLTIATNIASQNPAIRHIYLYADNTAAITSIFDPKPSGGQLYSRSFYETATKFLDSDPRNHIHLTWCPSHHGIPGNERVDRLAKQATNLAHNAPITISRTNAIRRAKLAAQKEWTQEWSKAPKHGWFAIADRLPPSLKPTKHSIHLSNDRERFGRLVQARTGHSYTGEFRRRFFPTQPHHCPCGEAATETREHIIIHCKRYEDWRWILREVSQDVALPDILGTKQGIEALAEFLDRSGAFTRTGLPREQPTNPTLSQLSEQEPSQPITSSTVGPPEVNGGDTIFDNG